MLLITLADSCIRLSILLQTGYCEDVNSIRFSVLFVLVLQNFSLAQSPTQIPDNGTAKTDQTWPWDRPGASTEPKQLSGIDSAGSQLQVTQQSLLDCEECNPIESGKADPKFPTVNVTGFFHLDAAWFAQDDLNRLTLGDIDDGLGFRRARLAAKGEVAQDISYIVEFDIAQSQARFVDVWVQANKTRWGNVRIGRYRQPFGMAELTSIRELPFLERPVIFTQSPFRQTGIMLFDVRPNEVGTWAISGYRFLSDNFGNVFADSGGYGFATRLTQVAFETGDNRLVHFGFDYSFNDPGRGLIQLVSTNEVFVGQNPNIGPSGLSVLPIVAVPPFVNTGLLAANDVQFINVEAAMAKGRMAVQSEARLAQVDIPGGTSAEFPGAYLMLRYVLTGEEIPYLKKEGVFGRVVPNVDWHPNGGIGAWEVVGRISHIDLNDSGINGRRLTNYGVGCNWYWNRRTKLQFNWLHSQLNDMVLGDSNANTFAARAQIDF